MIAHPTRRLQLLLSTYQPLPPPSSPTFPPPTPTNVKIPQRRLIVFFSKIRLPTFCAYIGAGIQERKFMYCEYFLFSDSYTNCHPTRGRDFSVIVCSDGRGWRSVDRHAVFHRRQHTLQDGSAPRAFDSSTSALDHSGLTSSSGAVLHCSGHCTSYLNSVRDSHGRH